MQETVTHGRSKHSDEMLLLLDNRIRNCKSRLAELKHALHGLPPELVVTYDKLVMILRSLSGLNTRGKVSFPWHLLADKFAHLTEKCSFL